MAKLSISSAWDETAAFLRRESRLVMPVALAFFAVPATLFGWHNPSGDPTQASGGWPLTLLVLVLALMGQMAIAAMAIGWRGSVGAALTQALGRVWGVLAALLIIFIPVAVVLALILAFMLGSAGLTDPTQVTAESLAAVPGLTLFLLAMTFLFLFIGARLFPISAVGMMETANPFRVISRSWQLTGGHFWRLVGTLLLILIVSLVASLAVTGVIGSLTTLAAGEPQPYNVSALIISLADGVVGAVISAVTAALVGRIYAQLSAGQATVPEVKRED